MEMIENKITMKTPFGTPVLIITTAIPSDLGARADKFYKEAVDAFCSSAREGLFKKAMAAYDSCEDRRRKYRFVPLTADFRCIPKEGTLELTISESGKRLRHELHSWKNDLLVLRKKPRL